MVDQPQTDTRISYEPRIVAFLDVLGFGKLTRKEPPEAIPQIRRIEGLFETQIEALGLSDFEISARMFSDCICLSVPYDEKLVAKFFNVIAFFQLDFILQEGCFIRGGVAPGRHYESASLIFSEGLTEAHDLESKRAVFPRVVVAKEFANRASELRLLKDQDELVYIDYLARIEDEELALSNYGMLAHKEHVEQLLLDHLNDPVVLAKYLWVAMYHNKKILDPKLTTARKNTEALRIEIPRLP